MSLMQLDRELGVGPIINYWPDPPEPEICSSYFESDHVLLGRKVLKQLSVCSMGVIFVWET